MRFVRLLNDHGRTYDSYTDFWSLVCLAGLATCEQSDVDPGAKETCILPMNSGAAQAIAGQPRSDQCRMILWQLERPSSQAELAPLVPSCWDEVWISDRWLAGQCQALHPRVKYVPIGGHRDLAPSSAPAPDAIKRYDFSVMAYLWGMREAEVRRLQHRGFTMAPNGWGPQRDSALAASRRGLCLHQDHLPIIEPLRYA